MIMKWTSDWENYANCIFALSLLENIQQIFIEWLFGGTRNSMLSLSLVSDHDLTRKILAKDNMVNYIIVSYSLSLSL